MGRARPELPLIKPRCSQVNSKQNPLPARNCTNTDVWKKVEGGAPCLQVLNFPFPTPPNVDALAAAERALHALGALGVDGALTERGRVMARLPLDPRPARMILQVSLLSMPYKW